MTIARRVRIAVAAQVACLMIATVVRAATFAVTRTDDTVNCTAGDCSLRGAIVAANTAPGADLVIVPAGTYTLTIAGLDEQASAMGDLDVNDAVTLQGAGSATTIVDAGGIDRVLHVAAAQTVAGTVHIEGLTLRNGGTASDGGGLVVQQAVVELVDVVVMANVVPNDGGGVLLQNGSLTLTNSVVSGNSAGFYGGGIHNASGALVVASSTIGDNSAGRLGGGIRLTGDASATLSASIVSENLAIRAGPDTGEGGGVWVGNGCTLEVADASTIASNQTDGIGGAVRIEEGASALIEGASTIASNHALRGGGIFTQGTLVVSDTVIGSNSADDEGGGVHQEVDLPGGATVDRTTVSANVAGNSGGGWFVRRGTLAISASTISANQAGSGGGGLAVAVNAAPPVVSIESSTLAGNLTAGDSGGAIRNLGTLTLTNSTLSGNGASSGGDAIAHLQGTLDLAHVTIVEASAPGGSAVEIADTNAAAQTRGSIVAGSCVGPLASLGGNLESPGATCGLDQPSDHPSVASPMLGALAANGGPTLTHAPLPGSPAQAAALSAACPALDQRGYTRNPADCDAGAVQISLFLDGFEVGGLSGWSGHTP